MMSDIMRKVLLEPVPATKFPVKSAVVLGIIYCVPLLAMISAGDQTAGTIIWGVGGGAAFLFLINILRQRAMVKSSTRIMRDIAPKARKALVDFIGTEPRYVDALGTITRNWNPPRAAGTGMTYDGQYLYVMDDGEVARLPWSSIRSWRWTIEGYNTTKLVGANRAAAANLKLEVNAQNANASAEAKRDSGFFIEVTDVDKPTWQFRTDDEKVLRRWSEIMTQIKEGRLATA